MEKMDFNPNLLLLAMNSTVPDVGLNPLSITDALLNQPTFVGDVPFLPLTPLPTYASLGVPTTTNPQTMFSYPSNISSTENASNQLTQLLMLDMLYVTTNGKCALPEERKIDRPETSKSVSPHQPYHVMTAQSPSKNSEAMESSTMFLTPPHQHPQPQPQPLQQQQQPQQNCARCNFPIHDCTTALIEKREYHIGCIKCAQCDIPMGFEETCFVKEGMILCRADYMKRFRRTCGKCDGHVLSEDMVMRVKDAVFHLECFQCYICGKSLTKGDLFTMSAQKHLFCHAHYEVVCKTVLCEKTPPAERPIREISEEPEDTNDEDAQSASNRSKRMRTSFKHQQLRTMKQYFHLNHNPDAKDLKQLAQKTGLTKRVLQVWFQNARAKFRRSGQHRDGMANMSPGAPPVLSSMESSNSHMSSSSSHSSDYNPRGGSPDASVEYYETAPTLVSL